MINNTSNNSVITPSIDPGETVETLLNLGTLETDLTITENIGGTDAKDLYQIEVTAAGTYNFTLDGLTANADIAIFDSQGQMINYGSAPDTQSESLDIPLTEGSYYVLVASTESVATEYTLNITHPNDSAIADTPEVITPTSDPEFTFDGAYDLGIIAGGLTVAESVGGTDLGDGYQFEIAESGKYSFTLDGLSANADLFIYDSEYNIVDYSTLTGSDTEVINLDLAAGNYFAGVQSIDEGETTYTFNISGESSIDNTVTDTIAIQPTEDPGYDSLDNAYDLGAVAGTVVVEENVGTDSGDLYKITVDEAGEYTFNLDGLTANADLYLYDPNDIDSEGMVSPFESSVTAGTAGESVTVNLAAGEYYVDVFSADGEDTNYSLTITDGEINSEPDEGDIAPDTSVITPPQDPGAGLDTAFDLGAIDSTKVVTESVGQVGTAVDTIDIYKFTAEVAGEYNFNLDGLTANADMFIFDPNIVDSEGAIIALETSQETGTTSEAIATELDAGEYYIGVTSADEVYTDYSLTVTGEGASEPPVGDEDDSIINDDEDITTGNDAGDTFNTAYDLGEFASGDTLLYTETVGGSDTIDAFKLTLEESAQFQATVDGLSADVDLYVYDSEFEQIGASESTGTATEGLGGVLDAGTYYVGVFSYDGVETRYDLSVAIDGSTATPPISLSVDALEFTSENFL